MSFSDLQKRISLKFTEDVLIEILRQKSGFNDVAVKSIDFGGETKRGESYLSTVTRFCVQASGKEICSNDEKDFEVHIIAKSIPDNVARRKTFRSVDFFANEITFYTQVWPVLDRFQKSKNLKNPLSCFPTCLSTYTDGVNDYIALEDVSSQGYKTLSRGAGLDVERAKTILTVFAQFHGLSLAFKDQHPQEFERIASSLQETYFAEKFRKWYTGSMDKFCIVVRDAVERHLPESYNRKLDEILEQDLFGEVSKICATRGPLAVITHGDCWAPNFLFKCNEDDLLTNEIILIDFQLSRCSSPVMDVLFFLNTCVSQETLSQKWDYLVEDYHEKLSKFVEDFGSNRNVVTLDALNEDMRKCGVFGFGMPMESIIMSLMEDEDIADIDMIQGSEEVPLDSIWVIRPIKNEEKRRRVANFFKNLVDTSII